VNVCLLLLELRAEVNAPNHDGKYPLHHAAFHGHRDIALLLLQHHAKLNAACTRGVKPLHSAAAFGWVELCSLLLEHRANVEAPDNEGFRALHVAACGIQSDLCMPAGALDTSQATDHEYHQFFRSTSPRGQYGCRLDTANLDDSACVPNHADVVLLLLQQRARLEAKGPHGRTPLHWAAEFGQCEIASLLLKFSANL